MGGNYLYICMYVCIYIYMYVCMYTMILPLHFSVPIYSPWQKKKKKKTQKIKRGAGPLPGPESICLYQTQKRSSCYRALLKLMIISFIVFEILTIMSLIGQLTN